MMALTTEGFKTRARAEFEQYMRRPFDLISRPESVSAEINTNLLLYRGSSSDAFDVFAQNRELRLL